MAAIVSIILPPLAFYPLWHFIPFGILSPLALYPLRHFIPFGMLSPWARNLIRHNLLYGSKRGSLAEAPPGLKQIMAEKGAGYRGCRQETIAPFDFFQLTIDHESALTLTFRIQLSDFRLKKTGLKKT
jgi:hypothetical protein